MAALEGSKSIEIRQCNENLAVVDESPLFRGAVIQGFHCIYTYTYIQLKTYKIYKIPLKLCFVRVSQIVEIVSF